MKLYIKYMISNRCKLVVKQILQSQGYHFVIVDLGEIDIMEDLSQAQIEELNIALQETGLELMDDKKAILIEKIKKIIIHMVHQEEDLPATKHSSFLSTKLGYDYTYMSNLFTEVQGMTIQQYIIINKIERVKELLLYDELNLTEISYKLQYSSVAHLSNQLKKITGLSATEFLHLKNRRRIPLEDIGNVKIETK